MELTTRCQVNQRQPIWGIFYMLVLVAVQVVVASVTGDNNIIANSGHEYSSPSSSSSSSSPAAADCFRAAVYQHSRIEVRREQGCQLSARLNLEVYERATRLASQNGAKIIVFPEDGLFIGSKSFILPCLHQIADPDEPNDDGRHGKPRRINPCLDDDADDGDAASGANSIMKRLSCMARDNNIYVVANFGTKEELKAKRGPTDNTTTTTTSTTTTRTNMKSMTSSSSSSTYLMLNTNVVFDAEGNFIKRYRKYNPFIEVFEKAPQLELAYFDTPHMGRLGLFTCFDILFKRPALELVEKYHINSLLYPTWWFDKLPMHSALQYQAAWAEANGVNLLAANLILPERGSVGSGIYSADGTNSIYTGADELSARLLVANVPVTNNKATCLQDPASLKLDVDVTGGRQTTPVYKPYGHFELDSRHDALAVLDSTRGHLSICTGSFCCHLEYQAKDKLNDGLVLIARDGLNVKFGWWEQVCLLAQTTATDANKATGQVAFDLEGRVEFSRLSISANFTTEYVLPMASQSVSRLVSPKDRHFQCVQHSSNERPINSDCKHELLSAMTINSFGFFARQFEKDNLIADLFG